MKNKTLGWVLLLSLTGGPALAGDPNSGFSPYPIIYYSPETSLGLGAGAVFTRRPPGRDPNGRPDSLLFNGSYTLENQAFVSLNPNGYFNREKGQITLGLAYINMPTQFFGIGNDAGIDTDTIERLQEDYTTEALDTELNLVHAVWRRLRLGVNYRLKNARVTDKSPGNSIDQNQLTGAMGGLLSGLGPVIDWDSRDNVFYPSRGGWYRAWVNLYRDSIGSDYDYERYNLDLRHYLPLKPGHILAFQGLAAQTQGQVPFYELPTPPIRGIYSNVFTHKNLAALGMEYRFPIGGRWSGAAFAAVGDVVDQWQDLSLQELKVGAGGGIRYQLDKKEKVNLRFDVGVSQWGVFPYINIMEAF